MILKSNKLLDNHKYVLNNIIGDVDYTSKENISYIFRFIKEQVNSKDLMFDLYVDLHEDEFYQEDFIKFEEIISKKSCYVYKIYNDNKKRQALFSLKNEKFTFDFFQNVIKYYSCISIYYNLNDIDCNLFFGNINKLHNFYYENIILVDFMIMIKRKMLVPPSDIDIKILCQELGGKYKII